MKIDLFLFLCMEHKKLKNIVKHEKMFNTTKNNITMHIKNIFEEGELQENPVSKESLLTASDGKDYKTKFYISN